MTRPARHVRGLSFFAPRWKGRLWRIVFLRFAYQESESRPSHLRPRRPAYRSRAVNRARTPGGTRASANCRAPNACRQRRQCTGQTKDGSGGLAPGVCPVLRITLPATPSAGHVILKRAARLFCGSRLEQARSRRRAAGGLNGLPVPGKPSPPAPSARPPPGRTRDERRRKP